MILDNVRCWNGISEYNNRLGWLWMSRKGKVSHVQSKDHLSDCEIYEVVY